MRPKPALGVIALLVTLMLGVPGAALAQVDELTVKAVALEKIARFVEWPGDAGGPFVLGLVGQGPLCDRVEKVYSEVEIKGRRVQVRRVATAEEQGRCHMLLLVGNTGQRLTQLLASTRDRPVLTVSDTRGGAERGVLLALFVQDQKLRFEVNVAAFRKAGLEVNPLLLKVARIVSPIGGGQ